MGFLHFGLVSFEFRITVLKLLALVLAYRVFKFTFHIIETEQGVALAILRGSLDFKREPWPQISESAKSLVRQMLEPDPKKRLTAQQVLGMSCCKRNFYFFH